MKPTKVNYDVWNQDAEKKFMKSRFFSSCMWQYYQKMAHASQNRSALVCSKLKSKPGRSDLDILIKHSDIRNIYLLLSQEL